jgi:hypothetical protein
MKKLVWLCRLVGAVQIILGLLYLFCPAFILTAMGHSVPPPDNFYPLAMLAARFIGYGVAFIYITKDLMHYSLWLKVMILIQMLDLVAGIFYTAVGIVPLSLSGFPMFNACWIMLLLWWWRPCNLIAAKH